MALDADKVSSAIEEIERELCDNPGASAVAVLLRRLAAHEAALAALAKQIEVLEAALRARDLLVDPPPTDDALYPQYATVCADHSLPAEDGFYALEHSATGQPYRWTGPGRRFGFTLYVDRSASLVATLRLAGQPLRFALQSIRCLCDDRPLATTVGERSEAPIVEALLPPRTVVGGSRLVYEVPSVHRPSQDADTESDTSVDRRVLGLAFAGLEVRPALQDTATSPAGPVNSAPTEVGAESSFAANLRSKEKQP